MARSTKLHSSVVGNETESGKTLPIIAVHIKPQLEYLCVELDTNQTENLICVPKRCSAALDETAQRTSKKQSFNGNCIVIAHLIFDLYT